ncbi:MAG: ABC transporter ATP-binding protein [Gammaproteobacteria bacterium]
MNTIGTRRLRGILMAGFRANRLSVAIALFSLLAAIALELLTPWPLKIVIDYILLAKPLPESLAWLQSLLASGPLPALAALSCAIAVIALLGGVFSYLQLYLGARIGYQLVNTLRCELFAHLQQLSLVFHQRSRSGELLAKVASDTSLLRDVFADWVVQAIAQTLMLIGVLAVMFAVNWRLAVVVAATLPVLGVVLVRLNRQIKLSARTQRQQEGRVVSRLNEVLSSIALVQAFGREDFEGERFALESAQSTASGLKNARVAAAVSKAIGLVTAVGTAGTVFVGAWLALEDRLTPGDLLIFVAYVKGLYKPVKDLGKLWAKFSRAKVSAERIADLLAIEPAIRDRPDAVAAQGVAGAIEFVDVSFGYDADKPILDGVSFRIQPGERVALIGASGAGKSTLVSLLLRLFEPRHGTILIDGRAIDDYTRDSLRREIGIVLQDTVLFGASIRDNIAYGKPTASDAEIEAVARLSHAHDFILALPDGYDSIVGERGCTLSGGQRQRLCLARALLKQPAILILDEPTAALDAESAALIESALETIQRGKTTLVIGHQFSPHARFDRVLALRAGKLVEVEHHKLAAISVLPSVGRIPAQA